MAIHKGPWQKDEDALLMEQVGLHQGANAWGKIADALGTRSAKQCRERWHQNLKPGLHNSPITDEEARFITHYVQTRGKRWAEIARQMNGRSDNMIKNWWNGSNNRRHREQCDFRRAPELPHSYPLQMQQPLPSFQPPFASGYAPAQAPYSYAPSALSGSSPIQAPSMLQAPHHQYQQREYSSNLFDRRQDWGTPSLQINSTQPAYEPRPSLSAATTPSSAGPPTPHYGIVRRASSSDSQSQRPYDDNSIDPVIMYSSSRRGSAYEVAHQDVPELPSLHSDQRSTNKSKMSLSNILH